MKMERNSDFSVRGWIIADRSGMQIISLQALNCSYTLITGGTGLVWWCAHLDEYKEAGRRSVCQMSVLKRLDNCFHELERSRRNPATEGERLTAGPKS